MPQINAYHRPQTLEEVTTLLARPDVNTVILAGGTYLVPRLNESAPDGSTIELVDLQALGLVNLNHRDHYLTLGAMVRLQDMVESPELPSFLREIARREEPNTMRNAATIGGLVAVADPESELLATLLVMETTLDIQSRSSSLTLKLGDFLAKPTDKLANGLIVSLTLKTSGQFSQARVARTPADKPIVAVIARRDDTANLRLAMCGVAPTPILVHPDQVDNLTPPSDFRGSSEYRLAMARQLTQRALAELGG